MLRLMLALFGMLWTMAMADDDGGEPPDDGDDSGDDGGGTPNPKPPEDDDANYHRVIRLKTEDDEEKFFDRNFRKRHRRMKEDAKKEARDELRDEIQAEYAADKTRAEQAVRNRNDKIEALEKQIEDLEGEIDTRDERITAANQQTDRYAKAIERRWDEVKDRVPDHVIELIEDRDVLYRVTYVEKHPDILGTTDEDESAIDDDTVGPDGQPAPPDDTTERGRVRGAPRTPNPANRRKRQQELDDEAAAASRDHVRQAL